jgi:hypothetical protein
MMNDNRNRNEDIVQFVNLLTWYSWLFFGQEYGFG